MCARPGRLVPGIIGLAALAPDLHGWGGPSPRELLVVNYETQTMIAYQIAAPGDARLVLDETDGLSGPFGANAIATDFESCVFIGNFDSGEVWRHCVGEAPVRIAGPEHGVDTPDAVIYDGGYLFISGRFTRHIVRIDLSAPAIVPEIIDTLPERPMSMAIDNEFGLYVADESGSIWRYPDPYGTPVAPPTLLGFGYGPGGNVAIALGPFTLYYLDDGILSLLDPVSGASIGAALFIGGHADEGLVVLPFFSFGQQDVLFASDYAGAIYQIAGGQASLFADTSSGLAGPSGLAARFACTGLLRCDANCDGTVTPADIAPFVLGLTDAAGYAAAYPRCSNLCANDVNGDGVVSPGDITDFVFCLTR